MTLQPPPPATAGQRELAAAQLHEEIQAELRQLGLRFERRGGPVVAVAQEMATLGGVLLGQAVGPELAGRLLDTISDALRRPAQPTQ